MPSLNTRTHLAIIGTTSDWCLVSLRKTLHKDSEYHVDNLQTSGQMDTKFCHHGVLAFSLRRNKMRMPKMNSLMSKQDVEFIDYYVRLRQCIVFELADEDWDWFKLIIDDYVVNGHLKQVVSCQASILELPPGPQSDCMTVRFLKSIKLQMSYAHYFRTIDCNDVQAWTTRFVWRSNKEWLDHIRTPTFAVCCYQCRFPQLKLEDKYWVTHLLMGLIWYLRAPPGDNCIFCTRIQKLMNSSCLTLLDVYALTYISISAKRSTSHAGVVRQSLAPGLMPRRDSEQWNLAGTWPHTEQLPFSVFLTKPTYKILPSWAHWILPQNSCVK